MTEEKRGLCFRCERRARALETGSGPRCECSNFTEASYSCYMYLPTLPAITAPRDNDDKRPRFSMPMLSSREKIVGIPDKDNMVLKGIVVNKKEKSVLCYWVPKRNYAEHNNRKRRNIRYNAQR